MDIHHYEMRITPYSNNEFMVQEYRKKIPHFIKMIGGVDYLFGQEYEENYHFHIIFSHSLLFAEKKKCPKVEEVRDLFYTYFEVNKKLHKGNKTHKLSSVRNLEHALSYAVKDGNYEASPEWIQIAEQAYESSFEKTHSLKRSLGGLIDQYIKNEISERKLWTGLGQTRANLELPLSLKWIDEMVLSINCKKNPDLLDQLWEDRITSKQKC